jgi:phosphatidylglycerophosphatase A
VANPDIQAGPAPGEVRFKLKKGKPDGPPGPWVLVASWGPCGYLPLAPGTFGTLGAIPLFWALRDLPLGLYLLTTAAFVALASFAAAAAGRYWKYVDASPIVVDEVAGYLVTMALVPWSWQYALLGFVLFRVFDVWKPWPARYFDQQVKNGFGVVMDDVCAGAWAWVALEGVRFVLRLFAGCSTAHWWCMELTP